jgi:integrase
MDKRGNEAFWVEAKKHWRIKVTRDGAAKEFTSAKKGKKGKIEAERKADAWIEDNVKENARVAKVAEKYLENVKQLTGTSNYKKAECVCRLYLLPAIGKKKIGDICDQDIQDVINGASLAGAKGRPLSQKTLSNIRGVAVNLIRFAERNKYLPYASHEIAIPKGAAKAEVKILQAEPLKTLFNDAMTELRGKPVSDWYIYFYRFCVVTGLRVGEAIGLKFSDIVDGHAVVSRSVNAYREVTAGKNANAKRILPLPEVASKILAEQSAQLAAHGLEPEYIFCAQSGEVSKEQSVYKRFQKYLAVHGIEPMRMYNLRHTFVSMMRGTVSSEELKPIVGHSAMFDTFGTYGTNVEFLRLKTAGKINDFFGTFIGQQTRA